MEIAKALIKGKFSQNKDTVFFYIVPIEIYTFFAIYEIVFQSNVK